MKITVLMGSPKGEESVTLQYVIFLRKQFPRHEFVIHDCASSIRRIEDNEASFRRIIEDVRSADIILWAFPLYYMAVCSQYMRFIELVFERGAQSAFTGKYTAALSTSIHFFDHTAHAYVNAICDDLNMRFIGSYSADMGDLFVESERRRLLSFAEHVFTAAERLLPTPRRFDSVLPAQRPYTPGPAGPRIRTGARTVLLIADPADPVGNIDRMIDRFVGSLEGDVQVCRLDAVGMKTGCIGCIMCAWDNTCRFQDTDGYVEFFNTRVKTADILVIAGAIGRRYLSSLWKMFFDRSFFNGHIPVMEGKQAGFILSGPLHGNAHLRDMLAGWCEMGRMGLAGFVTDESDDSAGTDALLDALAERLVMYAEARYIAPLTFPGVGGRKIFRDDIWGRIRFPFAADHAYYRKHGFYDFPQKDIRTRLRNGLMWLLMKIPSIRREVYFNRMRSEMVKPLRKLVGRL